MTDALLGAVALALVAATGVLGAMALRLRGLAELLLGAYLIAFAEVVGLTLFLSTFGAAARPWLLLGTAALLGTAVAGWLVLGAPAPPRLPVASLLAARCVPDLLALAVVTAIALGYVLALVLGTPPNNWDSLAYHLARAAFWSQDDGVGLLDSAYDTRLNAHPPNAEIALAFLLQVSGGERLVGFVQYAAALALGTGVFALARRVGGPPREAALGALLFLTLPLVLLQASTAQNDLVAASFLLAASVFVLGDSRRELTLVTLATALAIGTKVPAAYGLPVLVTLALVAPPAGARVRRLAALLVGAAVGSYWYVVNLVRTGDPLGGLAETESDELVAFFEPAENLLAAFARLLDAVDLSGATPKDRWLYAIAALGVSVVVLARARGNWGRRALRAAAPAALTAAPLALLPLNYVLWRVFAKLHDVLDEPDRRLPVARWEEPTVASDALSWFGPVGLVLVVGAGVAASILVRRGSLSGLALVLAAAPLAWFALFAVSIAYDPWQGRFFVYPVALSAALWGLVLRRRELVTATVAVASVTAALTLVHSAEKPSGLELLEREAPPSVWQMDRWYAQSVLRTELRPTFRFLERNVPGNAVLALALDEDDFGYPPFGRELSREIVLVPPGSDGRGVDQARWLAASYGRQEQIDVRCWRPLAGVPGAWRIFRRNPGCR